MNEKKDPGYIRLLPLSTNDFPSCECAKIFIENGFQRDGELLPGLLDIFLGDYYSKMFILFQYQGEIIGSGIMHAIHKREPYYHTVIHFDMDTVNVLEEGITGFEFKKIVKEFKKFNSVTQKVDDKNLEQINHLISEKRHRKKQQLDECSFVVFNKSEGGRIEYYTTKYERVNKYRSEAIRIHGSKCEICGFDFGETYGYMGDDYIEVHHIVPLFSLKQEVIPNPETDMICVCSNCHQMLHRDKYSIVEPERLKEMVKYQREKEKKIT